MRLLVRVLFAALLWLPTIASPSAGLAQVEMYLPTQAEMDKLAAEVRASMGIEATFETEEEEDAAGLGFWTAARTTPGCPPASRSSSAPPGC